ncbi:DEAD/DEAH box helicase [Embleya sp. NPDC020886]|uniref:DEAD/DEAH box helicase n=1 Tax=Embleya sp. NPDC020886 TaxID=3363980 RepID=UPI0037A8381A
MDALPPPAADVAQRVIALSESTLRVYHADPGHVEEHANGERRITQGGYGERQVFELVQNGADEIGGSDDGRIHVVLTETHLYCANSGSPITADGAETILRMSVSRKRGGQIGRFGVGVKSVLSVSDTPRFFSTSGSFGFDREWSATLIRSVVPTAGETPVLRMAKPLDLITERTTDLVLDELMTWASTVVVLPLKPNAAQRLARDLENFPSHFPLFSDHVASVVIEDRCPGRTARRVLTHHSEGDLHTIREEGDGREVRNERWRVFAIDHEPTAEARETAGELHNRPVIRLSWAVPEKGVRARGERGRFWAFFPTNYDTTLTGVVNAAWKTNEDRQNLLQSDFNTELITATATMIVEFLPKLLDDNDPGSYLPLLTARGREAAQWADKLLGDTILDAASKRPSLPDQTGRLSLPTVLHLHPEDLKPQWLALWSKHSGRPRAWVHHSVESRERRSRVRDIMDRSGIPTASVRQWLEALVADRSAAGSALALRIVADMRAQNSTHADLAATANILLTQDDRFIAPRTGEVFRRSTTATSLRDNLTYVHPLVVSDPEAARALDILGIPEADANGRFRAVLDRGFVRYGDREWTEFWDLVRRVGAPAADEIKRKMATPGRQIHVRTADRTFRPMRDCLLAGSVIPADGSRDAQVLVDPGFHQPDGAVLRALGMSDRPAPSCDPRHDPWFEEYREYYRTVYCRQLKAAESRPSLSAFAFEGAYPAGPLHVLKQLSVAGRAAFVRALPPLGVVADWTMSVNRRTMRSASIPSPLTWYVQRQGAVPTSLGLRKVTQCVAPSLGAYRDLLPVAEIDEYVAETLRIPSDLTSVPDLLWSELFERIAVGTDDRFVGRAYALLVLVPDVPWPEDSATRCRVGAEWTTRADDEIAVTADPEVFRALNREGLPALLVPAEADARRMIDGAWGMKDPQGLISKQLEYTAEGETVPLIDLFPRLRPWLSGRTDLRLTQCSSLTQVVLTPNGRREQELDEAIDHGLVLVRTADDDLSVLMAVCRALGLDLDRGRCQALLDLQEKHRHDQRFVTVRREPDPACKLLLAVGVEELREHLPEGLATADRAINHVVPDDVRVARLVIAAHGDDVLRALAPALREHGFPAPMQWVGGSTALKFVREYGFPASWAGSADMTTPVSFEDVPGPRDFPRLHSYQELIAANMYRLLLESNPGRAMLRLPTGAGKTRVAAEATIRALGDGHLNGPVLWIAQSAELCEQAIETWKSVWSQLGPQVPLRISRMWTGHRAQPVSSGPQLVVAVDESVHRHIATDGYAWLREASVVIVDEAHFAIPRSYTHILDQLGITQHRTARPLVGLTATPFRGNNVEETRRLALRFGQQRLDHGVFIGEDENNPYPHLQRIGVLSQVEQRELEGHTVTLTAEQRAETDNNNSMSLPDAVTKDLAENTQRTKRILAEIEQLDPSWPVLVFATSVEHSKILTALLNERGVTSAQVDGTTRSGLRTRRVDDFRAGRIRVLTNYNVFTQGFDAPAVRAVVVARPTYSPNTYIQMIGRGLRGPVNGGKESCLILNVRDNIENFGRDLAYTQFEYLWNK